MLQVPSSESVPVSFIRVHWVAGESAQFGLCSSDCRLEAPDKAAYTAVLRVAKCPAMGSVGCAGGKSSVTKNSVQVFASANATGKHTSSSLALTGRPPSPGDFFDIAVGQGGSLLVRIGRSADNDSAQAPVWSDGERFQTVAGQGTLRTDLQAWHVYLFCASRDGELRVDHALRTAFTPAVDASVGAVAAPESRPGKRSNRSEVK